MQGKDILFNFDLSKKKKEMDREKLAYILEQWAHQRFDALGPQAVPSIQKADEMKKKIKSGATLSTNELLWIMDIKKQLSC